MRKLLILAAVIAATAAFFAVPHDANACNDYGKTCSSDRDCCSGSCNTRFGTCN